MNELKKFDKTYDSLITIGQEPRRNSRETHHTADRPTRV